jgi:hypothetical protein
VTCICPEFSDLIPGWIQEKGEEGVVVVYVLKWQ